MGCKILNAFKNVNDLILIIRSLTFVFISEALVEFFISSIAC